MSHVNISGIVLVCIGYVIKINNYRSNTIGNFSTLVCRIEISQILFCLMLTFKLAAVLTLDQLRRLMKSVRMLVYSMESLLCLTIFKVINLITDNKTCCFRIVVFHCFIIFYICVCYFTYCLLCQRSFVNILLLLLL
jgi:hypothetical protein